MSRDFENTKEHKTFENALQSVLKITPKELKRRIEAEKAERKKRKPKRTSASGRASK